MNGNGMEERNENELKVNGMPIGNSGHLDEMAHLPTL
jgi:hypothetical protein